MKRYKGYEAEIEPEVENGVMTGTVKGIRDIIHFTGLNMDELEKAFHGSVDDYLSWAEDEGFAPEKPPIHEKGTNV